MPVINQTLESYMMMKLVRNKGRLVKYRTLHHYWDENLSYKQKQNLINQIYVKIRAIRNNNPIMDIKSIRNQGYIYVGYKIDKQIIIDELSHKVLIPNNGYIAINTTTAKQIIKLLK